MGYWLLNITGYCFFSIHGVLVSEYPLGIGRTVSMGYWFINMYEVLVSQYPWVVVL